jgi:ribonuclease G
MKKLMASDKAKHTVLPLTKFGLMQITRQRIRPVAVSDIRDVCPTCNGTGKIEPTILLDRKIENQISFLVQDRKKRYVRLVVSPYVAAFLRRRLWSLRMKWMCKYNVWIDIRSNQSLGMVDVRYQDRKGKNLFE